MQRIFSNLLIILFIIVVYLIQVGVFMYCIMWLCDSVTFVNSSFLCSPWTEVTTMLSLPAGLPTELMNIPREHLEIITGNLLGDGHISKRSVTSNGVFMMGQKAVCLGYLTWLFNTVYSGYSTISHKIRQSPPVSSGLPAVGYKFDTQSLPIFTVLHHLWYHTTANGTYLKVIPSYIYDIFSPLVLAIWFMDDGYYNSRAQTFFLCTDCFTLNECNYLVSCLAKLGIKAGVNRYTKTGYRIRVYRSSVPHMRALMKPHMHPDFMYKLG